MMTGGVSPMFFAGTLALWLDSRADGTILLASHLGALALGGLLLPARAGARYPDARGFPAPGRGAERAGHAVGGRVHRHGRGWRRP